MPTSSASPTPTRLNLAGVCYLYFPPKTKYDETEYPYRGNLYQVDPSTGHIDLVLTDNIGGLTTSPDGGQLVYVLHGTEGDQLIVRNLADGRDQTLFAGRKEIDEELVWSPDGQELAFSQHTGDLWNTGEVWVVRLDDQTSRKLADGSSPAWSPDSQQLAYVTRPRVPPYKQNSLVVVDRFGQKQQVVFDTDPQTWQAGQHIDFDPDYGGPLLTSPAWSLDGRSLLFSVSANPVGLYRIRLGSGEMLKLTSSRMAPAIEGQFVRGSDQVLALVGLRGGNRYLYSIAVTEQGKVALQQLNHDADIVTGFALSPDRRYVAFVSTDQEGSRITFSVYDLQAGKELLRRELFGDIGKPHLAPRGLEWAPR